GLCQLQVLVAIFWIADTRCPFWSVSIPRDHNPHTLTGHCLISIFFLRPPNFNY
ncbi:hypothetical protein X975_18977, partial [Stegodyphus mimosarum]